MWSLAGVLPWVGVNSRAVQSVADAVDELAQDALPALMEATSMVDPSALAPVDGRIDIAPLAAAAPAAGQTPGPDKAPPGAFVDLHEVRPAEAGEVPDETVADDPGTDHHALRLRWQRLARI